MIMVAAGNDDIYQRMCRSLGLADLLEDARFATIAGRLEHRAELHGRLERPLLTMSTESATSRLVAAGVPVSPVDGPGDDPRALLLRLPFLSPETPLRWAPALGADTHDVLRKAGLGEDDIADALGRNDTGIR
jgi:crotonobetainyl-CoA:carnitine CoA-transferase CaiB-like acyl-CoA transferase